MAREIDNTQDILDTRDVIARFEELESRRTDLADAAGEAEAEDCAADCAGRIVRAAECTCGKADKFADAESALSDWDEENAEELKNLRDFIDEGNDEWKHGETLVRESYFKTYAQELAEDIGALEKCDAWPATCIDWEHATRELQFDYSGADFGDVTYYYRS